MSSTPGSRPGFLIQQCARCSVPYDWRRSTSRSLRMTYCCSLCEVADLGATIEVFMNAKRLAEPAEAREIAIGGAQ